MPPFSDWLSRVLANGESVQHAAPVLTPAERDAVVEMLRAAFDLHALDVAGPPLAFHPDAALAAALTLARACWQLVGDDEPTPLQLDLAPSPSAHLSVDVVLRFLPAVYRRARLRDPESELTRELARLLCAWPFSGILADLPDAPTAPLDFDGHIGLQLLYAERLLAVARPNWVPPAGTTREWAERVFLEKGKLLPAPLPKEEPRA